MQIADPVLDGIRNYYASVLRGSDDLRTNACCPVESTPAYLQSALGRIDDEIVSRFYGCGSPIPLSIHGCTVLDLGCGTGRDVYIASQFVGQHGRVIGVDMTEEQLAIAVRHVKPHMSRFGYDEPNVDFRLGYIEDLQTIGLADESVDVVISNCVLNLSPRKERVFREIFRVLRPGGELFFSDVFADRRIPEPLALDTVLRGECLGGAMYVEDFRRLMNRIGYLDLRVVSSAPIEINDPAIRERVGTIGFLSRTIRTFKLNDSLDDTCEDYGQVARYLGTIDESPHAFKLDSEHVFDRGRAVPVCGNTAAMIEETRYGRHFQIFGDRSTHYDAFGCSTSATAEVPASCRC